MLETRTDIAQPGEVSITIERRILDAFFHLDKSENLLGKSFVQNAAREPGEQLPFWVIPSARKAFADHVRQIDDHDLRFPGSSRASCTLIVCSRRSCSSRCFRSCSKPGSREASLILRGALRERCAPSREIVCRRTAW